MRLGLFGGSFDPVHAGHLLLAEHCREELQLDQVWLIPAGTPPHKTSRPLTDGRHRTQMLELATAGYPEFRVSRVELDRSGMHWTIDTLQQIHEEHPEDELFLLMGADSLLDLPNWREPERIAALATVVSVNRSGEQSADPKALEQWLGSGVAGRVLEVQMPDIGLSSTVIRDRVGRGSSIRFMTPRAVEAYIAEHGLYAD